MNTTELNIRIEASDVLALLIVNNNRYYLHYDVLADEPALRNHLANEPEYIYNAVVALLKEMAS